jgi:hypothetical protein
VPGAGSAPPFRVLKAVRSGRSNPDSDRLTVLHQQLDPTILKDLGDLAASAGRLVHNPRPDKQGLGLAAV